MTTVREWINDDHRRRAPEFDFGTQWTREHDPSTEWAVTYNTGTGELYARTRRGDDVELLGQFADPQHVADAVPEWGRRSRQAGSLDWIKRELPDLRQPNTDVGADGRNPIYGVVLSVDGNITALKEPPTTADVAIRLDAAHLDLARVNTGDRTDRVVMFVDDHGYQNHLPVNPAATQLYGTGWPIVGDAIVITDDRSPLPSHVLDQLGVDPAAREIDQESTLALEWEDRHRDLERSERELGIDVDADLNGVAFDTDLTDLGDRSDAALEIDDDLDIEP